MRKHEEKIKIPFRLVIVLSAILLCCVTAVTILLIVGDPIGAGRPSETSGSSPVPSMTASSSGASPMMDPTSPSTGSSGTTTSPAEQPSEPAPPIVSPKDPDLTGYIVVLDPGHQQTANPDQEPIAPGSTVTKDKVAPGTKGVFTGRPEYEVNLEISVLLRDYLRDLGCTVYMTRTTNDVDISNIERAQFALQYNPDVYLRLHCDGSSNSDIRGIGVFVASSGNYSGELVIWGNQLGNCLAASTGATYRGCDVSSRYSGLNWATDIPSFLLEMGYMTNAEDDQLLSDPAYQMKICEGIADFISQMPIHER